MRWLIVAVVVGVVACTESSVPNTTEPPDVSSSTAQEPVPEPSTTSTSLAPTTTTLPATFAATRSTIGLGWEAVEVPTPVAYHPVTNSWILVDEESPLAWGGDSLTAGDQLAIVANDVFYTSPPNWQPTGETITQDTWSD